MTLGETLLLARRRIGLSQTALAQMMGVSPAFLSYVERDRKPLPAARFALLPPELREAVTEAMVAQKEAEIAALRAAQ